MLWESTGKHLHLTTMLLMPFWRTKKDRYDRRLSFDQSEKIDCIRQQIELELNLYEMNPASILSRNRKKHFNAPFYLIKHRKARSGSTLFAFLLMLVIFFITLQRFYEAAIAGHGEALFKQQEIPNTVHFVRQMTRRPDGSAKPLSFEFRHFLAYYSAHLHLSPDEINIWTDADAAQIKEATRNGNSFTKAVLSLPKVRIHHVSFPDQTANGVPITQYAHKSDFIRTRVMAKYGGIYLDDDAWVIRDLAPLRRFGFDNIFGRQWDTNLCQAFWMSTPNNTLMRAFALLQESEFDGSWVRASNELLTNLVKDVRGLGHDRHALILDRDAFFPGQWNREDDGLPVFYKVHEGDGEELHGEEPLSPPRDQDELINRYRYRRDYGWRRDWRDTYVIHGYSNAVREERMDWMFGRYGSFTPLYVLARKSNIARALYPALQHALETGFLPMSVLST
jgi:hypothetical protein